MTQQHVAERNVRLYIWVRILAKRVFLPLLAVYFSVVSGLSLAQIGLVTAFAAAVSIIAEIPSGYVADRFGKRLTIMLAGVLNAIATIIFVLFQNQVGVYVGVLFEAVGYAFLSGSGEALLHDSLQVLDRDKEYTEVASKAQSRSLFVNVFAIGLIPMTYAIDPRLPFLFGTVAYIGLFFVGVMVTDVAKPSRKPRADVRKVELRKVIARNKKFIPFAIAFGLFGAMYLAAAKFQDLAIVDFGLEPSRLGWLLAITSLTGAFFGTKAKYFKRMGLTKYLLLDSVVLILSFAGFIFGNLYIAGFVFITSFAFWRYRKITYQDFILQKYPTSYKATLLSTLNNIEQLHMIWLPILVGAIFSGNSFEQGFVWLTCIAVFVSVPFVYFTERLLRD